MRTKLNKKVIKETYGNGDIFYKVQFDTLKYIKIFGKEYCNKSSVLDTLVFKNEEEANAYAELVYKPSEPVIDYQHIDSINYRSNLNFKAYKIFTKYDNELNKLHIKWVDNGNISYVLIKSDKIEMDPYIIISSNTSAIAPAQFLFSGTYSCPSIEKASFDRNHIFVKDLLKNSDKAFQLFIRYINEENIKYDKEKYDEIEEMRLKNTLVSSEVVTTINNEIIKSEKEKELEIQKKIQNETNELQIHRSKIILDEIKRVDEYKENLRKLL